MGIKKSLNNPDNLLEWVKFKIKKLDNTLDECFNVENDFYVTIQYVEEVDKFQICYHQRETFDVIITLLEMWVNSNWVIEEIDKSKYPPMWFFPNSLDKMMNEIPIMSTSINDLEIE